MERFDDHHEVPQEAFAPVGRVSVKIISEDLFYTSLQSYFMHSNAPNIEFQLRGVEVRIFPKRDRKFYSEKEKVVCFCVDFKHFDHQVEFTQRLMLLSDQVFVFPVFSLRRDFRVSQDAFLSRFTFQELFQSINEAIQRIEQARIYDLKKISASTKFEHADPFLDKLKGVVEPISDRLLSSSQIIKEFRLVHGLESVQNIEVKIEFKTDEAEDPFVVFVFVTFRVVLEGIRLEKTCRFSRLFDQADSYAPDFVPARNIPPEWNVYFENRIEDIVDGISKETPYLFSDES